MTPDEAVAAYSALSEREQLRLLADYAHELTVIGRGTYTPQTDDVTNPRRLRLLSEVQHRVTGHMRHLISGNAKRYPDDVLVRMIIAEDDADTCERIRGGHPAVQITAQCSRPSRRVSFLSFESRRGLGHSVALYVI